MSSALNMFKYIQMREMKNFISIRSFKVSLHVTTKFSLAASATCTKYIKTETTLYTNFGV